MGVRKGLQGEYARFKEGDLLIHIVGGGLAGSEAAFRIAGSGHEVVIHEMRPSVETGVHTTGKFAELVCSNSLKSDDLANASGLLKHELEALDSFVLKVARKHSIPGGKALVVDREEFSKEITEILESEPLISIERDEIKEVPEDGGIWIIASGPATSENLYLWMVREFGEGAHFFDAVAPVIETDSIDMEKVFFANRYEDDGNDYLNCPMNREEYESFREELVNASVLPIEGFDRKLLFSRCQPIEEIARSGVNSMRFGPLKPVGLIDTEGKRPYAVVQLRRDNSVGTLYNLVGFQTRLKWGEQERVLKLVPGLQNARIVRYGVMHANVYIEPFRVTDSFFRSIKRPSLFFAGQITGVEGYVESIASGLYVSENVIRLAEGKELKEFPKDTMIGALMDYVSKTKELQPMYANFGLVPSKRPSKKDKRKKTSTR